MRGKEVKVATKQRGEQLYRGKAGKKRTKRGYFKKEPCTDKTPGVRVGTGRKKGSVGVKVHTFPKTGNKGRKLGRLTTGGKGSVGRLD